jgi:hypothetical protein
MGCAGTMLFRHRSVAQSSLVIGADGWSTVNDRFQANGARGIGWQIRFFSPM